LIEPKYQAWAAAALAALAIPTASAVAQEASDLAYRENCASCHGEQLQGRSGPPLAGPGFAARWAGKDAALFDVLSERMPLNAPGSLSRDQYFEIFAWLKGVDAGAGVAEGSTGSSGHVAMKAAPVSSEGLSLPAPPDYHGAASTSAPQDAELVRPSENDWLQYNRDYGGQRYSSLRQITLANVASLRPQCLLQLGEGGSFEASPLIRNGRLYVTTPHETFAVDAVTCQKLWTHRYVPSSPEPLPTNRGVALYQGMIFRGTTDGHLLALDAMTGKLLWDVRESDSSRGYFLSGAPVAFADKVYIGEAGADYGAPGHVRAFEAKTGKLVWTFDLVPTGNEPGADTWPTGSVLGGSSSWSTISVDPVSREIFVPSGNPGPDVDGSVRQGSNLYSDSAVVLDADTGQLHWYVQQIPHDIHDWDTSSAPVIYSSGGRRFMAVGSKDARLYLYDRDTHRLIASKDLARRWNDTVVPQPGVPLYFCPGFTGGVEWFGPAYDPTLSMLYVNAVDRCATMTLANPRSPDDTIGGKLVFDPPEKSHGSLRAFNAFTGAALWADEQLPPMIAGVTPTAGGVLFTGTAEGDFLAVDERTGRIVYRFFTGGPIGGGVSVYGVKGKEYVAVASGNDSKTVWGTTGAATIVIFSLP
jgi:alcohol dehydrogenase (cytochrome c)